MKVALVHDDLIQEGGAEKLLLAMHEMWPEAPIYTSFASKEWLAKCRSLGITVKTSFMQMFPFKESLYRFYFLLYPIAFESFNFDDYDLVVSSSARFAHGIITKPKTLHICYMNSPGRMWWEPTKYFEGQRWLRILLAPLLNYLRMWDYTAAQRVDYFIANSKTPQARIKKYFGRESDVVYPFAEVSNQQSAISNQQFNNYFLVVTRLVPWKRVDIAIEACRSLGPNLIVVGRGPDLSRLQGLARGSKNITFLDKIGDNELAKLYSACRAVIITQEEDFGIVAVEAASFGKPVLAFKAGGSLEIIKEGITGEFFYPQTVKALSETIESFDSQKYKNEQAYEEVTNRFGKTSFKASLGAIVKDLYDIPHS